MAETEPRSAEIGYILFNKGRSKLILWSYDSWSYELDGRDVPELAEYYRLQYWGQFRGPSAGYYGQLLLRQVASDVGGEIVMIRQFPDRILDPYAIP